jgi:hypothetical protein
MKKFICTSFLLLFFHLSIFAGWFECYNFIGFIDKYPITLSIQIRDGYFGTIKPNYNILGVYKYDKYNTPIYLDGYFDRESNVITLFEYNDEKTTAKFTFEMTDANVIGKWKQTDNEKTLKLTLTFNSKLIDINESDSYKEVPIIFESYNQEHYFVGIYNKLSDEYRAKMMRLNIYQRNTNKLIQVIDFSNSKIGIGNIMTNIYDNLEANGDWISLHVDYGQMGDLIQFKFNNDMQKYELEKHENDYINELVKTNGG